MPQNACRPCWRGWHVRLPQGTTRERCNTTCMDAQRCWVLSTKHPKTSTDHARGAAKAFATGHDKAATGRDMQGCPMSLPAKHETPQNECRPCTRGCLVHLPRGTTRQRCHMTCRDAQRCCLPSTNHPKTGADRARGAAKGACQMEWQVNFAM